jgi:CDP-6-deoxy-D-xylo-4-hexulose-3-dehydrase
VTASEQVVTIGAAGRSGNAGGATLVVGTGLLTAELGRSLAQAGRDVTSSPPGPDVAEVIASGGFAEVVIATRPAVDHPSVHVHDVAGLVEAATAVGARVTYLSDESVFDGRSEAVAESEPPDATSPVGRARAETEEVVGAAGASLVVRSSDLFGWDPTSEDLAMAVWRSLSRQEPVALDDLVPTTPTSVTYLVEVVARLLDTDETGVVHLVQGEPMTELAFARSLARALDLEADLLVAGPQAAPGRALLAVGRVQDILGTPPPSIDMACRALARKARLYDRDRGRPVRTAGEGSAEAEELRADILEKVARFSEIAHAPRPFVPFESVVQYAGRNHGPEEVVNLVSSALDFWLTMGPHGDRFEHQLSTYFEATALMVSSGSTANLNAFMALMSPQLDGHLVPGDEVITPAVTFPTTLAPIVQSGLVPVFVDCEIGSYNVDVDAVAEAISDRTRAIVVPHTLGNPCDLDVLQDLARAHDLFLMEDSCDALGSRFRGQLVGTFGDIATLSFYPAHHITTGEGGAVIARSPRLARIARSVRDWGRDCWCAPGESNSCAKRFGWQCGDLPQGYDHKFTYSNIGFNFKATDMQAAVGSVQFTRLPAFIDARRRNFALLYEGLRPFEDRLVLPTLDERAEPAWFGFPITVRAGTSRDGLVAALEGARIETRMIFAGNILRQPGYRSMTHRRVGDLAISDQVMRDSFFLGVHPGLTEPMVEFVIERVGAHLGRRAGSA